MTKIASTNLSSYEAGSHHRKITLVHTRDKYKKAEKQRRRNINPKMPNRVPPPPPSRRMALLLVASSAISLLTFGSVVSCYRVVAPVARGVNLLERGEGRLNDVSAGMGSHTPREEEEKEGEGVNLALSDLQEVPTRTRRDEEEGVSGRKVGGGRRHIFPLLPTGAVQENQIGF